MTFVLGTWQVKRLQWKLNLIKELDEKLSKEPLHLPNMIECVAPRSIYYNDYATDFLVDPAQV